MYIFFDRVKSRRLGYTGTDQATFDWDFWGVFLLLICIVFLVTVFVFVPALYRKMKSNQEKRMVELNGKMVDSKLLVTVTMIGYKSEILIKKELFIAPLIEKEGCDFVGWWYDSACTIPYVNGPVKSDIILYPKWVKHSK